MANAKDQMKMLEEELGRIRSEIEKLQAQEALLVRMLGRMSGDPSLGKTGRKRSPSVKPVVLDVMREKGEEGATTAEVDELVRIKVPSVAKDTVGSILSRLKADGALAYDGERYYEKKHAPKTEPSPFDSGLRAVS